MKNYRELEEACMAFKLQDGNILMISRKDVNEIAAKIVVEHVINERIKIDVQKDSAIDRANYLYSILTKEKEMTPMMKSKYLEAILDLMKIANKEELKSELPNETIQKKETENT